MRTSAEHGFVTMMLSTNSSQTILIVNDHRVLFSDAIDVMVSQLLGTSTLMIRNHFGSAKVALLTIALPK